MLVELGKPEGLVGVLKEIHSGIRGSCQHYYLHQGKTSTYHHSNKPKPSSIEKEDYLPRDIIEIKYLHVYPAITAYKELGVLPKTSK